MQRRVLFVDDHILLTETLSRALAENGEMVVVAEDTLDGALTRVTADGTFDTILLDYDLSGEHGLTGLKRLMEANGGRVALFSGIAGRAVVDQALSMGASGFLPKTVSIKTLVHAINFIADGEVFVPASYSMTGRSAGSEKHALKSREESVLALLAEGMPNKQIANTLGLSESIVKLDVKSICRKLGVQNRTQAVIEARRLALI